MKPELYPIVIVYDRYGGSYSGGLWTAFHSYQIPDGAQGGDNECADFWRNPGQPVGKGPTPNQAVEMLCGQVRNWQGPAYPCDRRI